MMKVNKLPRMGLFPLKKASLVLAACLLLITLLFPAQGDGHTYLDRSDPPDGATVEEALEHIRLTFNSTVKEVLQLSITSSQGDKLEPLQVTGEGEDELTVTLKEPLPKGDYEVAWQIVSEDGHIVEGSLSFAVNWQPQEGEALTPPEEEAAQVALPVQGDGDSPAQEGEDVTAAPSPGDLPEEASSFILTSLLWLIIGALIALIIIIFAIRRRG